MTDKDKALFDGICQKNNYSFELLYKGYYKKLYILAFRYVRQQELAEEIVNDVFLKIWKDARELTIKQSLGAYLSRCVVNLALNTIKKENRTTAQEAIYLAGYDELAEETDEAQLLEDQLIKLEKAMETLPPACKKVLMMSKFEKRKQQEIAEVLNISVKTVKSHLTNGYEKIRSVLSKQQLLILFFFLLPVFQLGLNYLNDVL